MFQIWQNPNPEEPASHVVCTHTCKAWPEQTGIMINQHPHSQLGTGPTPAILLFQTDPIFPRPASHIFHPRSACYPGGLYQGNSPSATADGKPPCVGTVSWLSTAVTEQLPPLCWDSSPLCISAMPPNTRVLWPSRGLLGQEDTGSPKKYQAKSPGRSNARTKI